MPTARHWQHSYTLVYIYGNDTCQSADNCIVFGRATQVDFTFSQNFNVFRQIVRSLGEKSKAKILKKNKRFCVKKNDGIYVEAAATSIEAKESKK